MCKQISEHPRLYLMQRLQVFLLPFHVHVFVFQIPLENISYRRLVCFVLHSRQEHKHFVLLKHAATGKTGQIEQNPTVTKLKICLIVIALTFTCNNEKSNT